MRVRIGVVKPGEIASFELPNASLAIQANPRPVEIDERHRGSAKRLYQRVGK